MIVIPEVPAGKEWFSSGEFARLIGMRDAAFRWHADEYPHSKTLGRHRRYARETLLRVRQELGIDSSQ